MQKHVLYRPTSSRPPPLTCVDVDALCKYVACGTADYRVLLISARTGRPIRALTGHEDLISSIVFLRSNNDLLSASWDGSIRKWHISRSTQQTGILEHKSSVKALTASTSSDIAAAGFQDGTVIVFSTSTMRPLHRFKAHTRDITAVKFTRDEDGLLTASWDGTCKLWQLDKSKYTVLQTLGERIHSMLFLPERSIVLLGLHSGNIVEFSLDSPTTPLTLKGHLDAVVSLVQGPSNNYMVSGSWDRRIRIWDLTSLASTATYRTMSGITDIGFCRKTGSFFVSDFSGTITMWSREAS